MTDVRHSHDNVEAGPQAVVFDKVEAFRRRKLRLRDEVVTSAHGAGGKASAALIENVFAPAFGNDPLAAATDAAVLSLPSGDRLAFSTDSFVVKPLRFPGGSVGHLAVHGTVNDLAMMGRARWPCRRRSCSKRVFRSTRSVGSSTTWRRPRRPSGFGS